MLLQLKFIYDGTHHSRIAQTFLELIDKLIEGTINISDPDASVSFEKSPDWSASPDDPILKAEYKTNKETELARIMDAGLMKAIKAGSVPLSYAKDYVKSLERMAKRNAKKFFDEYGNFSEDDFIEDVEYNMANESKVNEAKFSFSEDQVKDVAELIAKAIGKMDKSKTAVHDMEYDAGRGAGFEISMDGERYEGGSYVVRPNGEVYNAAIGNSFPNAVYAKIGDTDIRKVMKNINYFRPDLTQFFTKNELKNV